MRLCVFPFDHSTSGTKVRSQVRGRLGQCRVSVLLVWTILLLSFMTSTGDASIDVSKVVVGGNGGDDDSSSSSSHVTDLSPTITTAPSVTIAYNERKDQNRRLRTTCESGQRPKSTSKFGRVFCSQSSRPLSPLSHYLISASSLSIILWTQEMI
ncbi:hypothetical protein HI914_04353 [Erysiphe necator]|nr:hypothetical protein HI914_04353 [Erysiphe necator]